MTLPKRNYFYLKEVADKLEITDFDLQDYISQGFLRAYVYLTANEIRNRDSELYYLDGTLFREERYFYLHPDSCREIFASGFINEWRFYISTNDYVSVPDRKPKIVVREKSLMISDLDLECFIDFYELNREEKKSSNRPGRPSSAMTEVLAEYEHRVKNKKAYKHKAHEALALHNWAQLNIKDKPVPGVNTIRGWLSEPKDKPANAA